MGVVLRCEDCGTRDLVGGRHGFCAKCLVVHRDHCTCLGTNDGDDCSLQPAWMGGRS